jgi:hypothetical protein
VVLKRLLGYLEYDGQALLDRSGDAGGHLRGGVPVVGAHRAASLLASATGRFVAHQLVNDAGRVADVLAGWASGDDAAGG